MLLNIKRLSTVADYVLVCSADSERQVEAISREVEERLREKGIRPLGVEGAASGRWALLDFNDVIAHVFLAPVRERYNLEGLWADAERVDVPDDATARAGKKR